MTIEFNPEIFQSVENFDQFVYLLKLFYLDRRYNFFVDLTQIKESPLYKRLDQGDKDLIDEYFTKNITGKLIVDHEITEGPTNLTFSLEESRRFFVQPVIIIVENNLYDMYFVNALLSNFNKESRQINRHISNGWLSIENAGGKSGVENYIHAILNLHTGRPKPPAYYLRCCVLVDSDSQYPGHITTDVDKLRKFLAAINVPCHILNKREMENYLPDEVLIDINATKKDEYISAYLSMNALQKDYFDLQNGFPDLNLKSLSKEVQALYESVPDASYTIFRKQKFNLKNFKSEFPKYFSHEKVNKLSLTKRVSSPGQDSGEFVKILEMINSML